MDDMDHQYRIIAEGAGWVDRSARGRLRFEGTDALTFLQALFSNDVLSLRPGAGLYATYLTPLGRMLADLDLLHRDSSIMALVPDGRGPTLATRLDSLIFAEDLRVTDVTAELAEVAVVGARAAELLGAVLACDAGRLAALTELDQVDVERGFVVRTGEAPLPTFHVILPASERDALIGTLSAAGVIAIDEALATALRIEAGRPLWGADLTHDTIPLEAGLLDRAISTTKGCYVGQEVVIRILHRGGGRVAKRLAVLAFDESVTVAPPSGAVVMREGQEVGHVTSAAYSPARRRVLALAYVHRDAAEIGRRLEVASAAAEIAGFAH